MRSTLSSLVDRFDDVVLQRSRVIPWSSPVPSFGDPSRALVATLGLNPSNREFVDVDGNELRGPHRRFHTLGSLGLAQWSHATGRHLRMMLDSCRGYFTRNPYDSWFKKLDFVIGGTRASYYDPRRSACHLDLIPYATSCKWTELRREERTSLLTVAGDTLALLLRDAPIRLLILNGASVISNFESVSGVRLEQETMPAWTLPRRQAPGVEGISFKGRVRTIAGMRLDREVLVLGYNHNIQSSFGVTREAVRAIRKWIALHARSALR